MIKFTFNVDEAFERLKHRQFDYDTDLELCYYDKHALVKQDGFINKLVNKDKISNNGIGVLTAIYNSFAYLFDYNMDEYAKFIDKQLTISARKYSSMRFMSIAANNAYNSQLEYRQDTLKNSYKLFTNNVKNKHKGMAISYNFEYNPLISMPFDVRSTGHAISLFGYNKTHIFYKENSQDNFLFRSLAYYIRGYYKFHQEYNNELLKQFMLETDNNKIWILAEKLLGYSYNQSLGLDMIYKDFLTDGNYFHNSNNLIIDNSDINDYNDHCDAHFYNLSLKLSDI